MVIRTLIVGTLLSQNNLTERRPVVVIAERQEDRRGSSAKLLQHLVDNLIAFGGAVIRKVAADDDERRSHVELFDTCQPTPHLPTRVDTGEEFSGWRKMQIAQLQKCHRHRS